MNKYFTCLAVVSLFIALGLNLNAGAPENPSDLRTPTPTPKISPKIEKVELGREEVYNPCEPGRRPKTGTVCDDNGLIKVETSAVNPQNAELLYYYTVSGGRIVGKGRQVSWDLKGVRVGTYTITVAIGDDSGVYPEMQTKTVQVKDCNCMFVDACPVIEISTPTETVKAGETITFTANVSGGLASDMTYNWTVSQGEIIEGQGTPKIKVKAARETAGSNLTATLQISSEQVASICETTASETVPVTK